MFKQFLKKCYIIGTVPFNFCTMSNSWPDRIISGIQPTGILHIGNYYGAVKNWINLQNSNEIICSIVDFHSITLSYDHKKLPENILLMTACLLGCGLNSEKSILFLQSEVPQHTQLCWVLSCLTTVPRLARQPQYREKSENIKDIPSGLFFYPVLQAADILIYKATKVPVGKDQLQHLQLASHLARKFNALYGETFPIPELIFSGNIASKIKNLRNPHKKMSKSYPDKLSRIEITDSPDDITEKIKKAVTDCTSQVTYEPDIRPGVSNLVGIHSVITGRSPAALCDEVKHLNTGQYKLLVAEILIETLKPIQKEINQLLNDKSFLISVLKNGAIKASKITSDTWTVVRKKIGCHYFL